MIRNKSVHLLLILIFWGPKPVSGATFENVSIILKLMNSAQPEKILVIASDNRIDKYADVQRAAEVIIRRQNVPKLGEDSVINLAEVKLLSIIRCGLTEISPGAFKNLSKLQELNLSDNLLAEIKNGVFAKLGFNTLYLQDNQIGQIGDQAFNDLQMTYLFIDNNRIPTWKSEWFNGTLLTAISMGNNLIESLPRHSFQYLQLKSRGYPLALDYLILNNNRIKSIDRYAFEGLKELSNLDLQDNQLEYLEPGLFDSVAEIYTLQLGNNKIRDIYYEVFRYTKVIEFETRNNLLECISTDIFHTTDLARLYVDGNPITCDCLETWEQWRQKNRKLVIDNFAGLKQNCIDKTWTQKNKKSVLDNPAGLKRNFTGKSSTNKNNLFLFLTLLILRFVIK